MLLFAAMITSSSVSAQADTLQAAQQLAERRDFRGAETILADYTQRHDDVSSLWLYASVAHWAHHDKVSVINFKRALNQSTDNTKLRLDYARMLFESERLYAAQRQLDRVIAKDDSNVEAHLIRSNIRFWYGRMRPARKDIYSVTSLYPQNATAQNLRISIDESTSPYLKYTVGYLNDDQPVQAITNSVESGIYYSWLLSPRVQLTSQDFYASHKWNYTLWANFSNKFLFGRSGTDVSLSAGVFKSFSAGADWTGDVTVHQKLYKYLTLQLEAERRPYLSTLTSVSQSLMQNTFSASIILDKSNSWSAQAAYRYQFYNDKNPIQTAYVWALSQPIRASVFQFRFGYGYNYSTSARSTFRSVKSVNEILSTFVAGESLAGVYDPYFTPIRQHIHSAIVSIKIKPVKFIDIGIKADIGFYAQGQNPYVYLDQNAADGFFIGSGMVKQVFHPYKLAANIDFKISRKITLGADYTYTSGFFYSSHYTSLHLAISFLNHVH